MNKILGREKSISEWTDSRESSQGATQSVQTQRILPQPKVKATRKENTPGRRQIKELRERLRGEFEAEKKKAQREHEDRLGRVLDREQSLSNSQNLNDEKGETDSDPTQTFDSSHFDFCRSRKRRSRSSRSTGVRSCCSEMREVTKEVRRKYFFLFSSSHRLKAWNGKERFVIMNNYTGMQDE